MDVCIFLDLDDTIFQSRSKCPAGEPAEAVAFGRDQAPVSYMTTRQREFFNSFSGGMIIPTTARTRDAFRRVTLPFHQMAILDFGAVVLQSSGELDQAWDDLVRPQAMAMEAEFHSMRDRILQASQEHSWNITVRVIVDFDMPLFLVVKHPRGDLRVLRSVAESACWPREKQWKTHFNGNNLTLMPSFLGKQHAVAHVIETHLDRANTLVLGCGDSHSDAAFLKLCDYAIIPPRSQLGQCISAGD